MGSDKIKVENFGHYFFFVLPLVSLRKEKAVARDKFHHL
jgi:hypothetical protein